MDDGGGLTDSELTISFRTSNIWGAYQFKNGIIRQTTTMDFAAKMGRCEQYMQFLENFPVYMGAIGRRLQNEFNGNNT